MRKAAVLSFGIGLVMAGIALAEPLSVRDAARALYRGASVEIEIVSHAFMGEADAGLLETVGASLLYYAAIAAAPGEGILSPATLAGANHHDMEDAEAAALKACDEAKRSEASCVIVARVRPKGWEPQALHLSQDATEVFRKEFRRARGVKAFASAPGASRYGFAVDQADIEAARAGALKACGDPACKVVVEAE